MSESKDIQEEIKKVEERFEQGLKELQTKVMEQKKVIDEFVKERPYIAMSIVFVAGLTLGTLAALMARSKD